MLRIFVTRQTRYPANTKELKGRLKKFLSRRGATDCDVSLALVGTRKMKELAKSYLHEDDTIHEVLSFPADNPPAGGGEFAVAEDARLQLGDIVICYPEALKIAMKKNRMVDDVLGELAEHGMLHLLGIHHE
ncbi:rRNA maturation RNase YbeY [Candidatus Woesebacteria bacterium]|nr:rRNA maturation RNase YbeY [Candidatus Woesebacteria bacterium]|tara:strand:- start:234 stop:629 length:396 start_codon:yes stop_codon:yes gene_type:complete